MFSPPILSRLTEDLRLADARVDDLEQQLAEARHERTEWSRLIELAQDVQLAPAGVLVAETRERGQADWCLCGQPQTPGMVHSLTRCYEGELDLTPALPQPGAGDRVFLGAMGMFERSAPAEGAWFGSGAPYPPARPEV